MKRKYYIAYGSNLHMDQMLSRCPDAVKVGSAVIENYKLLFRSNRRRGGVATIEPAKGESVPVGIWAISASDEIALDHYEGFPWLYEKWLFPVRVGCRKVLAMAYIMTPGHGIAPPSSYYLNIIAEGYHDFGFDTAPLLKAAEDAKLAE